MRRTVDGLRNAKGKIRVGEISWDHAYPDRWYGLQWWPTTQDKKKQHNQVQHVALIMESVLGELVPHEKACQACVNLGVECWMYTDAARLMVNHAVGACARCRMFQQDGGCPCSSVGKSNASGYQLPAVRAPKP